MTKCPVCLSIDGFEIPREPRSVDNWDYFDCPVCGVFGVFNDFIADYLAPDSKTTTRRIRATLSHWLRLNQRKTEETLKLYSETFKEAAEGKLSLPNPAQLALAIIRYIGDYVQKTGEQLKSLPPEFSAHIGATSRQVSFNLIDQLVERNLVQRKVNNTSGRYDAMDLDLTLVGWETFQSEKAGQQKTGCGFLAMKFGDPQLESLTQNHLKPAIRTLGFDLVDMRDVAEPGIIDIPSSGQNPKIFG